MIGVLGDIYLLDKLIEFDVSESFCKAFCNHLISWNKQEFDFFENYLVTNVVVLNINIFSL